MKFRRDRQHGRGTIGCGLAGQLLAAFMPMLNDAGANIDVSALANNAAVVVPPVVTALSGS